MRLFLSALTDEDLRVRVRASDDEYDPTGDPVEGAFTAPSAEPVELDWSPATWEAGGPPYRALVRANQDAGTYRLWVRVTTANETVVRRVGLVDFE